MISEQVMGRKARADAITTLQKLAPKTAWWLIGAMGVVSAFLIMAFYTEVAGWVFAYVVKALSGRLLSTDPNVTTAAYTSLVSNPWWSLIVQWVVLLWVAFIIGAGRFQGD